MNIGEWIKEARHKKSITQYDIADATGLSRSYISKLESGTVSNPSFETLTAIVGCLGYELDVRLKQKE